MIGAQQAGDVALLVVEQPLRELVRGVDDGLGALDAAGVEGVPELVVHRVGREQQLGEDRGVLEGLGGALGQRRAGRSGRRRR